MGSNFVTKIWMSIADGKGMYFSFVCLCVFFLGFVDPGILGDF